MPNCKAVWGATWNIAGTKPLYNPENPSSFTIILKACDMEEYTYQNKHHSEHTSIWLLFKKKKERKNINFANLI